MMKTIQITIDETLLANVNRVVAELHTNRSLFIRKALHAALHQREIEKLEARHANGYAAHPQQVDEIELR